MLVATKNAIVEDSFHGEVRLFAGESHVCEDHELARAYPDLFRPAPGRERSRDRYGAILPGEPLSVTRPSAVPKRSGSDAASAIQPPPDWHVAQRLLKDRADLPEKAGGHEPWRLLPQHPDNVLSERQSDTAVRISAQAETEAFARLIDSGALLEDGILIRGRSAREMVEWLASDGPGDGALREAHSLRFDPAAVEKAMDADPPLVGTLHTHPVGGFLPSRFDLAKWSELRRGLGLERLLAIIACPTRAGWELAGYVVRAGAEFDVTERVRLRWPDAVVT